MDNQVYQKQQEIESGELTVVGLNAFTVAEEEERLVPIQRVSEEDRQEQLNNLKELRRSRDNKRVKECLEDLRKVTQKEEENIVPAMFEAVRAYATLGEISGAVRMGYGYDYDPFGALEYPF